jgi:hypothetical protein
VPPGSTVSFGGRVSDNYGGVGWKLTVVKDKEVVFDQVDYDRKLGWDFTNLPEGIYEVVLEAEDHADHIVTDKMTIIVEAMKPDDEITTTDDPTTGGDPGGSSGDDPASAGETDGSAKDGCECSAGSGGPGGLLGLPLMGLWGLLRARSRARRTSRV